MKDWDLALFISITLALSIGGGFYLGRKYEYKDWSQRLPAAMEQLCIECSGLK